MVSEQRLYPRWTPEAERWLIPFLEATEDVGHDRLRRLLKHIDNRSSGGHAVVSVVAKYQGMLRSDILAEYTDQAAYDEADKIVGLNPLRWHRIKQALRMLHPQENAMAPETQLLTMKRDNKRENLLEFVLRYRRSADEFIRNAVVTRERCLQILFQKLPEDLQKLMSIVPFGTATLDEIERIVRSKLDWMAITTPGVYVPRELGDYMEIDALELHAVHPQGEDLCNARDKIISGSEIRFDAIANANGVMIAWKKLMDQPRFFREAERFISARKKKHSPHGSQHQPHYMAVADDDSAEDDDVLSPPQAGQETIYGEESSDPAPDKLCMMQRMEDEGIEAHAHGTRTTVVCHHVRPKSKPSMHLGVEVGGKRLSALVDTGATNCFIQWRTLQKLGMLEDVSSCDREVTLGNGESAPLAGRVTLKAIIDHEPYDIDAYVINGKGPPLILGYRFLEEHGLIIDCKAKTLLRAAKTPLQCHRGEMSGRSTEQPHRAAEDDNEAVDVRALCEEVRKLTMQVAALVQSMQKNGAESLLTPAQH